MDLGIDSLIKMFEERFDRVANPTRPSSARG
jgi:hypothetical protein